MNHRIGARKQRQRQNIRRKSDRKQRRSQLSIFSLPPKKDTSIFTSFSSISPRMQGIAFFISLLIISGYVLEVRAQVDNKNAKDNKDHKKLSPRLEKLVQKTCTKNPFTPVNRPLGGHLDSYQGSTYEEPCALLGRTGDEAYATPCKQERLKWDEFFSQTGESIPTALLEKRNSLGDNIKVHAEVATFYKKQVKFTPKEKHYFDTMVNNLNAVEAAKIISEYAKELGIGNCGENVNHNLYTLLKSDTAHELKLQVVEVTNAQGGEHGYLLINSNAKDTEISNNRVAATEYMKQLQQGLICDTWNDGFLAEIAENKNEYYISNWDSVKVKTVSLDVDPDLLPKEANQFINRQLKRLGLKEINLTRKPPAAPSKNNPSSDLII